MPIPNYILCQDTGKGFEFRPPPLDFLSVEVCEDASMTGLKFNVISQLLGYQIFPQSEMGGLPPIQVSRLM